MIHVEVFTFNPVQENTYVLTNEKREALIIDPGMYFTAEEETLQKYLDDGGFTPVKLVNTHCHFDHVFGNAFVAKKYNLELHLHEMEQPLLQAAVQSVQHYGLSFINYNGNLNYLKGGDTVAFGDNVLQVLDTPGHSLGSISLYCEADHFVIAGDALFKGSVGRTDLPMSNTEQLLQSIRTQLYTLPDDTVVYPGHGEPTTIGEEKKNNPFCKA